MGQIIDKNVPKKCDSLCLVRRFKDLSRLKDFYFIFKQEIKTESVFHYIFNFQAPSLSPLQKIFDRLILFTIPVNNNNFHTFALILNIVFLKLE